MIYLDHNATTPLDPRVRDAMMPWLDGVHGNPSSAHRWGRQARRAVETARQQVAELIGGRAEEVIFCASGTEANNAVIFGAARHHGSGHLIFSTLEHPSIQAAARRVAGDGMEVTEIRPGADGVVAPSAVEQALRSSTRLVCQMIANNELGTVQPVAEIGSLCRQRGVAVLCDAVQAAGKIALDVGELGVDYLVVGGHKFHGPLGIAALWARADAPFEPLLVGAAQEGGRRASTENVPGIVGLGEACRLANDELAERHEHLLALRRRFEAGLTAIDGAVVHCADAPRLPHTTHVAFAGASGYQLMQRLDEREIAVSTGSACHSGAPQPSAALEAMGVGRDEALASLRVSFGMTNTAPEVDRALAVLAAEVAALREKPI